MKNNLFLWSVPIKILRPARLVFDTVLYPWTEILFKLPVHTFITIGEEWLVSPKENDRKGYWFCAGDFCPTDHSYIDGIVIEDINQDLAICLVKPDIQKDEPEHEYVVISGSYLLDFVCHNIANRILYATNKKNTLIDTSIDLTGYKAIINTPLGIYGRHPSEWILRVEKCMNIHSKSEGGSFRSIAEEIYHIHLRATDQDQSKAKAITTQLKNIDERYAETSINLYGEFESGLINVEEFNKKMEELLRKTIVETSLKVGDDMAKRIYGDFNLNIGQGTPSPKPIKSPQKVKRTPPPEATAFI